MKLDNSEKLEKLKSVGLILRPNTPSLRAYVDSCTIFLKKRGIETLIDKKSAQMIGLDGVEFDEMCKIVDILISIGGDGTIISVTRRSFLYQKPILGINMGNLGFLTDFGSDEITDAIDQILYNDYKIDARMVMQIDAVHNKKNIRNYSINDIVIRQKHAKMCRINLDIDGYRANSYYGDALIVATPTGSTGYNLSAGGPIVFPYAKNFIFTPICAHSLNQRPLVLPVDFDIRISVETDECICIVDGQDEFDINLGDELIVSMSPIGAKMLHKKERNFFKIMTQKLGWGSR